MKRTERREREGSGQRSPPTSSSLPNALFSNNKGAKENCALLWRCRRERERERNAVYESPTTARCGGPSSVRRRTGRGKKERRKREREEGAAAWNDRNAKKALSECQGSKKRHHPCTVHEPRNTPSSLSLSLSPSLSPFTWFAAVFVSVLDDPLPPTTTVLGCR